MTRPAISLHEQIDVVEGRVRLDKLRLKVAVQGIRSTTRHLISGNGGLAVIFLSAAVVGAIGARKLTPLTKPKQSQ